MGGFHKGSYDDSNVLLAGGGHKPLNEFLTGQDHYKTSPGAGTAGTSSNTSGSTLSVPYVTVNANGHVTGYGTHTHTVTGFATSDHNHNSIYAKLAEHNNLTTSGNEFTFASSGLSGGIYINYRTAGGTNGNITEYYLGNGKGGVLGTAIHSGNYTTWCAAVGHTHTLKIEANSGNPSITLSANTTYKLTAGGSTYLFKTPADLTGSGSVSVGSVTSGTYQVVGVDTSNTSALKYLATSVGHFYFTTSGAYHTSDERMKHDIWDILQNDVDTLFGTNNGYIRHFAWNNNDVEAYGFIAQELEEFCPEAIHINEDGYYGVNYNVAFSKILGAMFKKIKQQDKEIKKLKKIIEKHK